MKETSRSVFRKMLFLFLMVFASELCILGMLEYAWDLPPWEEILLDAVLIDAVLVPALYIFFCRPMVVEIEKKEHLNQELTQEVATRERAERLIQEANEKLRVVVELAPNAIVSSDAHGNIVAWNKGAEAMFGLTEEEALGKALTALMPEHYRKAHQKGLERVGSGGDRHVIGKTVELAGLRKDGSEFPVELSLSQWKAGEESFYTGILRDISERKQSEAALARQQEELERSNAELEHFAYVASHDLQEPLRMVTSYTQLLAKRYEGKLDSDADEFIRYAVDGAERMQKLINGLLDYSRVGTRGEAFRLVDCNVLLKETLKNLETAVEESKAVINFDVLPTVAGDAGQLGRVFQNLIGNALKFRGKTAPRIFVKAKKKNGEALFSIQDEGIGIDSKYAERVFAMFQRLHGRDEYPGSGIGLALCRKIVLRHGGRIWFESQPGHGTTFFFTLPLQGDSPL